MILHQDCSSHLDSSKNMATRGGRGLFSLYIYVENFKNLLVRNHWTDYHIILQECSFGDLLPRLFTSKNMAAGGRGLFSLYIYIENFKNLLVRNYWTDFNIILQECSFGDLLPRLFTSKTMAARGRGLFSLYIYIENFKNLLVRNHWTDFNRAEMFLWWFSTKIIQAIWIRQKTWPPGGGAYFPYIYVYIYIYIYIYI